MNHRSALGCRFPVNATVPWYPLLRDAAVKNARISAYPAYAAELGGEKMLPVRVALAGSLDTQFTRLNAVMAMGSTGSRKAIPYCSIN